MTCTSISDRAQTARDKAKFFGGKALTGSAKQKEWAEKIRAEKLFAMTQDQAEMACAHNGLGRSANFWIQNRERSGSEIGNFFMQQKAMLRQAQSLRAAGRSAEYEAAAAEYNALTLRWGFTEQPTRRQKPRWMHK